MSFGETCENCGKELDSLDAFDGCSASFILSKKYCCEQCYEVMMREKIEQDSDSRD